MYKPENKYKKVRINSVCKTKMLIRRGSQMFQYLKMEMKRREKKKKMTMMTTKKNKMEKRRRRRRRRIRRRRRRRKKVCLLYTSRCV